MQKSLIKPMPEFFDRYIHLVEEEDLFVAFQNSFSRIQHLDIEAFNQIGEKVYQPGKWTIKDILQHIIDNERIQAYRALRFARHDASLLPGYDEELFGKTANANRRSYQEIVTELQTLRVSTIQLFKSFDKEALLKTGICFDKVMSPLALGFVIIGHEMHHLRVIEERYMHL